MSARHSWILAVVTAGLTGADAALAGALGDAFGDAFGDELAVKVVDALGRPCPGAVVHLVAVSDRRPESPNENFLDDDLAQAVADQSGCAVFTGARAVFESHSSERFALRLAIAPVRRCEVPVSLADLDGDRAVVLKKPPTGSLVLRFDEPRPGTVLLRATPTEEDAVLFGPGHLVRVPIVGDRAVFEEVAVGHEFQYQVFFEGEAGGVRGRVLGPTEPGSTAIGEGPPPHRIPRVTGRWIDEQGVPLASASGSWSLLVESPDGDSISFSQLGTDAEGRFTVEPTVEWWAGDVRAVSFEVLDRRSSRIALGPERKPGLYDVGDVVLFSPGARIFLATLDDEALLAHFHTSVGDREMRHAETCLSEMARRGTERCRTFLEDEWQRVEGHERPLANPLDPLQDYDLELLTALRRAEGRADPLRIEIDGDSLRFVEVFESCVLACTLRNVDPDARPIQLQWGGGQRCPERFRVEARAADRSLLPAPAGYPGAGRFRRRHTSTLVYGEGVQLGIPLADYVDLRPGQYDVAVLYHDQDDIGREEDLDGRILSRSAPLHFVVLPKVLELRRSNARDVRRWVDEIDVGRSAPLVGTRIDAHTRFLGEATRPEDRIVRLGLAAVPILIDRFAAGELESARVGWVLALLYDLTEQDWPTGTEGSYVTLSSWPGTESDGSASFDDLAPWKGTWSAETQRSAVDRWIARASYFEITWVED